MNKQFGKIENGNLQYAPNPLWVGKTMIANPTASIYEENGYKEVRTTEQPQAEEGYYWSPIYAEEGGVITQGWERKAVETGS